MESLRIIFMGTPKFAVGILDTILQNNYTVVGIITVVDKPAGRGQKVKYSAVKEYALKKHIPILQPTNLKDENFLKELKNLNGNLQIVVAFRMLPEIVWKMPKLGTFNLHASLLPNYRGAAPINWAIINGETRTGVTSFFIDDKIDTGAMILSKEIEITSNENAGQLHDQLMLLGGQTVIETLALISKGDVKTIIQEESVEIKTAYKLNKENCKINWTKKANEIHNLIRGLSPYPSAWTIFQDKEQKWNVKIYETDIILSDHTEETGTIITTKKELKVAVKDGYISILNLQFPGKKKMTIQALLNGIHFSENAKAL